MFRGDMPQRRHMHFQSAHLAPAVAPSAVGPMKRPAARGSTPSTIRTAPRPSTIRTAPDAGMRFMADSFAARRQRYHRLYRRGQRAGAGAGVAAPDGGAGIAAPIVPNVRQERRGSRHRFYPCCGRRRNQCSCDWSVIVGYAAPAAMQGFKDRLGRAMLLRVADTADTSAFLEDHATDDGEVCTPRFMMICMAYRRYNRAGVWKTIIDAGAFPCGQEPVWDKLQGALRVVFEGGGPVLSGVYYPSTLRSYSVDGINWSGVAGLDSAAREFLTLRILWDSIPRQELADYVSDPSRETFAAWYDKFMGNIGMRQKGAFGEYNMKLILDLLLCSKRMRDEHISRWPIHCPGYQAPMRTLFPGMPKKHWYTAMLWLHREVAPRHNLLFAETLMHLCWDKRRQAGALKDSAAH